MALEHSRHLVKCRLAKQWSALLKTTDMGELDDDGQDEGVRNYLPRCGNLRFRCELTPKLIKRQSLTMMISPKIMELYASTLHAYSPLIFTQIDQI